jgi:hypothetical protein
MSCGRPLLVRAASLRGRVHRFDQLRDIRNLPKPICRTSDHRYPFRHSLRAAAGYAASDPTNKPAGSPPDDI